MHHLRSFQLRDMTACGAALRRLGTDAASLEQVADRLVRHLYKSLTMGHLGEPACSLVRLFKTTPYSRLTPDLRALADIRLGNTPPAPSLTCLTLLASAGAVPGWNDPTRSSRFRVIPLDTPEAVERLPMFSQLFRQLGVSLPSLTQPGPSVLLDQHEQSFNVFHIPEAEGSPYVPGQEEFVRTYGIRSVLDSAHPCRTVNCFPSFSSAKTLSLRARQPFSNPSRLCAQIALAPYATTTAASHPHQTSRPEQAGDDPTAVRNAHLQARITDLERLLAVHEQTVDEQADRMDLIVQGSQMGTWDWEIPTGRVTFNERWASMLGYRLDELEPHVRTWEQLVHPDDLQPVMATGDRASSRRNARLLQRVSLATASPAPGVGSSTAGAWSSGTPRAPRYGPQEFISTFQPGRQLEAVADSLAMTSCMTKQQALDEGPDARPSWFLGLGYRNRYSKHGPTNNVGFSAIAPDQNQLPPTRPSSPRYIRTTSSA
jgi:hypothetical protein